MKADSLALILKILIMILECKYQIMLKSKYFDKENFILMFWEAKIILTLGLSVHFGK